MLDYLKHSKVLVTGHTGFKGSWLASILLGKCKEFQGISLPINEDNKLYTKLKINEHINASYFNLCNLDETKKAIKQLKPDYIFHFAAQPLVQIGYCDPINTFKSNVLATQNLLEAILAAEIDVTTIIATTDKVYKNNNSGQAFKENDELGGDDPYSASKVACEHLIHCYYKSYFEPRNLKIGIGRAGNVIGGGDWSRDRIIPDIIRSAFNQTKLKVRAPNSTRPWQHVIEPLIGYLELSNWLNNPKNPNFDIFNFGPDRQNVKQVQEVIDAMRIFFPNLQYETVDAVNKEAIKLVLDVSKARKTLGVRPKLNFQETVKRTANWYIEAQDGKSLFELCYNDIKLYLKNG